MAVGISSVVPREGVQAQPDALLDAAGQGFGLLELPNELRCLVEHQVLGETAETSSTADAMFAA